MPLFLFFFFFFAARANRTFRVAKYLLETCNVDAGTADNVGYTPLAIAAQGGRVAIVRMLLRRGVANLGKNAYRDAITGVAMTGNMEMLRELVFVEGGVGYFCMIGIDLVWVGEETGGVISECFFEGVVVSGLLAVV